MSTIGGTPPITPGGGGGPPSIANKSNDLVVNERLARHSNSSSLGNLVVPPAESKTNGSHLKINKMGDFARSYLKYFKDFSKIN
jgi:hypothetical protein